LKFSMRPLSGAICNRVDSAPLSRKRRVEARKG
jgi:hypothetical protein